MPGTSSSGVRRLALNKRVGTKPTKKRGRKMKKRRRALTDTGY